MFKDRIFSNKSTASRELGKLEIPRDLRGDLIVGEQAPFTINEKLLKKVLAEIKGEFVEPDAETIEKAVEAKLAEKHKKATQVKSNPMQGENEKPGETLKPVKVVKNGKTYPMKGTCKAIWDMCEKLYNESNEVPTPAKMQEVGIENNWHKVTVYRQFNDWKKFKGL